MKIWVYISIYKNKIFVFSVWNIGAYFHMWQSYFLYFLYENMRSGSRFSSLDSFFLACGDYPLWRILPTYIPSSSVLCSLSSRLSPAFIVCELVRMPIVNGGIWFLVVVLFGICAVIRSAEHLVPWGSVVFYLNFFLRMWEKLPVASGF